jgi:hypothetical protein
MDLHLAQVNIGRILAPMDSPTMAEFADNLDRINTLAEQSPGFIWRLQDVYNNNATSLKFFDDDFMIVNMSVWDSADSLFNYVYRTDHVEVYKKRASWFEKMPVMHMALWYTPIGHIPTVQEAMERLEHIRNHGDTPFAFTFRKRFTVEDAKAYTKI